MLQIPFPSQPLKTSHLFTILAYVLQIKKQPTLCWIEEHQPLPDPAYAWGQSSHSPGLLAAGEDLSTGRLREAYSKGIFPWYSESQPVLWWSTDPRMVLMVDQFRIHHSFKKTLTAFIKNPRCEIRIDSDFPSVIRNCAKRPPKANQEIAGTWILPEMPQTYSQANQEGFVHSVETWIDGLLVGGLYCVSLGKAVFGESMFSLQKDASKIALAALVAFCRAHEIELIDCQQNTSHLASLGAYEIARSEFIESIRVSQQKPSPTWKFQPEFWSELFT